MIIKLALYISVVLQFAAAIIALTLVRRTRTNIAWWLISTGFLFMAIRRLIEIIQVYDVENRFVAGMLSSWMAVFISVIMLASLIFIKRIFNIQRQIEKLRKNNESRVLAAIIKTEEMERQNFAKELHDGLGPLLSSVKMVLSAVSRKELPIESVDKIVNAEKLIDDSVESIKEISNKLSPHILNNFGVYKALKSFINKLSVNDHPRINLNCNFESQRFSYNLEVVLYRVLCELLVNTIKHANANNVFIDLIHGNGKISLYYLDDGVGFDKESTEKTLAGMGYSNIKSRIKSINGNINIFSRINEGVRVAIEIKLV